MKVLRREDLILALQRNFEENDLIFEDNRKLKWIWEELGDDWHIDDGRWQLTTENEIMKKARESENSKGERHVYTKSDVS